MARWSRGIVKILIAAIQWKQFLLFYYTPILPQTISSRQTVKGTAGAVGTRNWNILKHMELNIN